MNQSHPIYMPRIFYTFYLPALAITSKNIFFIAEILLQLDKGFYHNDTTQEIINALTAAKVGVIYRISAACDLGDLVGEDVPDSLTVDTAQEDDSNHKLKWNFYNS